MEKEWRLRETVCVAVCLFLLASLAAGAGSTLLAPVQERIIAVAERMIGGRYEHGGYDPEGRAFDCGNFVRWVYRTAFEELAAANMPVPPLTFVDDMLWIYFEDTDVLEVGDILMNGGPGGGGFHAGIYHSEGRTIEARGGGMGINIFPIAGYNRHAPFGQTGLRFSHFSLRARLWRDPTPLHPYVYIETPATFYLAEKGMDLVVRGYVPEEENGAYMVRISLMNALDPSEVLKALTVPLTEMEPGKERIDEVLVPLIGLSGTHVYIVVELKTEGQAIARFDTFPRFPTRIF